jgi:hypothetical protein
VCGVLRESHRYYRLVNEQLAHYIAADSNLSSETSAENTQQPNPDTLVALSPISPSASPAIVTATEPTDHEAPSVTTEASEHQPSPRGTTRNKPESEGGAELEFQIPPFYSLLKDVGTMQMISPHGGSLKVDFVLNQADLELMKNYKYDATNKPLFVLLCGIMMASSKVKQTIPVEFPQHFSVRINFLEVSKTYLDKHQRKSQKHCYGLPIDITPFIKRKLNVRNTIDLKVEYHAAIPSLHIPYQNARFLFAVKIAEKYDVPYLLERLQKERYQSKEQTIAYMKHMTTSIIQDTAKESDELSFPISQTSLRDPLSRQLIQFPCRGAACRHVECFDALIYLTTNEQHPKWQCPICNRYAAFEDLTMDHYFEEILAIKKQENWDDNAMIRIDYATGDWFRIVASAIHEVSSASKKRPIVAMIDLTDSHDGPDDEHLGSSQTEKPLKRIMTSASDNTNTATSKTAANHEEANAMRNTGPALQNPIILD